MDDAWFHSTSYVASHQNCHLLGDLFHTAFVPPHCPQANLPQNRCGAGLSPVITFEGLGLLERLKMCGYEFKVEDGQPSSAEVREHGIEKLDEANPPKRG